MLRAAGAWMRDLGRRRVPVVLQMNATECGAACLAMILAYHGRPTNLSEIRDRFGIGRDGVKARSIVNVGRASGLRVRAFSVELSQLGQVPLPAIIHWNFNHFVVLERWAAGRATIVDPAGGRRVVPAQEVRKSFTGVALTFERGAQFERRSSPRSSLGGYLRGLLDAPGVVGLLGQVLLASVLLQVLALGLPFFTKVVVDEALPHAGRDLMTVLGLGMAATVLLQVAMGYLRAVLLMHAQTRFDARIMQGLFEHLLALPFKFFQLRTSGDLLTRLGSGAVIRELCTNQTLSLALDGSLVFVCLIVLLVKAPLFGAVVLGAGLVQALLLASTAGAMRELVQRHLVAGAESQSFAIQAIKGIATLKASAAEPLAFEHWSELLFKDLEIALRRNHLSALVSSVLSGLRTLVPFALLWLGAGRVLDGRMSLGTMLGLSSLASIVLGPMASLIATGQQLQLAGAHLARIADMIDAEPEARGGEVLSESDLRGRIELRGVGFRYEPEAAAILEGISTTIEPGQKVAIVGRTGSGKSTLARLLIGLEAPTEGEILFDGVPFARLDLDFLRRRVGVVFQEPFLFSGSIRNNISLNDPTLPLHEVEAAARLAGIDEDVARMPMAYETWLGEDGGGLSGGQRQRVSLARALAHRPTVLVLDEATSHLDAETEARVDRNLSLLSCTRVVIAHRLSTVRNADRILVLDAGKLVEQGTHAELLAQGGLYATIVRSQPDADADADAAWPEPRAQAHGASDAPRAELTP